MKLCKDTSLAARAVTVSCVKCSRRVRLSEVWADTEGKAFVDYYCEACAKSLEAPRWVDGKPDATA